MTDKSNSRRSNGLVGRPIVDEFHDNENVVIVDSRTGAVPQEAGSLCRNQHCSGVDEINIACIKIRQKNEEG